jgi:EAL domain-containing protein (putative c-di-GMP-specific phosphodiesterase class I)
VHDVAASRIAFEVTETVLVEDFELASSVLSGLRRLGCFVGLDDFGAGYSSLGYLRRLPLDFIKIDRSLIDAIDTDSQARTIVSSVVSLAKALSLVTIAEGVERESLVAPLFEMGCDYGQGWHFGRALPR